MLSPERPIIHIPKTRSERVFDTIGYAFFFGAIVLLLFVWNHLPDKVPAHYNALGEVDRWGNKIELIVLPIVGGFLLVLLLLFERAPEFHNYPKRLNASNAKEFYLISRKMLNRLKNMCLIILSILLYQSIAVAMNWWSGFGVWFLPLLIIGTMIPIGLGLIQQKKIT